MKKITKLFSAAMLLGLALTTQAEVTQDSVDLGEPDVVDLVFSSLPDTVPGQQKVKMDLYVYNDSNNVLGATMGFKWDFSNLQMDSAVASDLTDSAFGTMLYFYNYSNINSTNSWQCFLFGGASMSDTGVAADPDSSRLWASYYFTLTEFDVNDSIVFDTLTFSRGSKYKFVTNDKGSYKPSWSGPKVVPGPRLSSLSLTSSSGNDLTTDSLTCSYTLSGTATTAATAWIKDGSPLMSLFMPMEGGASNAMDDYSGNWFSSTSGGSPTWDSTGGHSGTGVFIFDGSDDELVIPDDDVLDVDYVTLAAWIYVDSYQDDQRIISKEYGTSPPYSIYTLLLSDTDEKKLEFRYGPVGEDRVRIPSSSDIPLNQWVYVAATFDGSEVVLYIDGDEDYSESASGTIRDNNEAVYIGGSQYYVRHFDGRIDDVRIYDYALTPEQIETLHDTGPNVIVAEETDVGDKWQAFVTPFSSTAAGFTYESDTLTIQSSSQISPSITSTADTTGIVGLQYSYDVNATGNPTPTYSLSTYPSGMTINSTSGLIGWTPDSSGSYDVLVVASNSQGADSQSFSIEVTDPSSPVIANLSLTSTPGDDLVTDTLICSYDIGGTAKTAATAWYKDSLPLMALFLPMEGGASEAMEDYSGNGLTTSGGAIWDSAGGNDDYGAFEFDGNDSIMVADNSVLDVDYVTLAAWIYVNSYENDQRIISKAYGTSHPYSIYALLLSGPEEKNLEFRMGLVGDTLRVRVQGSSDVPLNTWVHVAATFDGSSVAVYIDGAQDTTFAASGVIRDNDNPVYIGTGQYYDRPFDGMIDDVRIYNHALSEEQIDELHDNGGDVIRPQETSVGDEWQAKVTPFSSTEAGDTEESNSLTIQSSSPSPKGGDLDVELPDEYYLSANYPNPFNPSTSFEFGLPVAGHVKLIIYNISGQQVTSLVDQWLEAGHHKVVWDGGSKASGVYLYRLTSGEFVESKKMVLLK